MSSSNWDNPRATAQTDPASKALYWSQQTPPVFITPGQPTDVNPRSLYPDTKPENQPNNERASYLSDRNAKENFGKVDVTEILSKVVGLPIQWYNFIGNAADQKCIGPMAQDWAEAFPSSKNPCRIEAMDLDGVAIAAIQALAALSSRQAAQLQAQGDELRDQEARISELEDAIASVDFKSGGTTR